MANGMDSAVDLLKDLLSSPDAGEKISSLLSTFQNNSSNGGNSLDLSGITGLLNGNSGGNSLDLSGIAGLLNGNSGGNHNSTNDLQTLPIANIMNITKEYQRLSNADDPRVNLLKALRPYLQPHRAGNLENAIKILGFIKLMPLLGNLKDII